MSLQALVLPSSLRWISFINVIESMEGEACCVGKVLPKFLLLFFATAVVALDVAWVKKTRARYTGG